MFKYTLIILVLICTGCDKSVETEKTNEKKTDMKLDKQESRKIYDFTPEKAHPKAKELLKEDFYWSEGDDNSPLGNDDGNDAFKDYKTWRLKNPNGNPNSFLNQLLESYEVPAKDFYKTEIDKKTFPEESIIILIRDNTVVALSFSQLILEGEIDPEILKKAIFALDRLSLPIVLEHQNWKSSEERLKRIAKMKAVLNKMKSHNQRLK